MNKYWPDGIELTDTQSPKEILNDAKSEWSSSSDGLLDLILQDAESKSGHDMIIVHAKHAPSNRTASLFSVVCRKGQPYPARLQPKDDELPNFFKKSYKTKDFNTFSAVSLAVQQLSKVGEEKWVENHWVADTPSEFREKLEEVFNLGVVKSEILNLISTVDNGTIIDHQIEEKKTGDHFKTSDIENSGNDIIEENPKPSSQAGETDHEG